VRHEIEQALMRLFGTCLEMESSSRTDAGVHARGLSVHVVLPVKTFRLPAKQLRAALNSQLPEDIRVMRAKAVPSTFHARFDAIAKEYHYQIYRGEVMPPKLRRECWHIAHDLDIFAMQKAAHLLIGRHDFRHFTVKRKGELLDSHRTLIDCRAMQKGTMLTIRIIGVGFLYKMCRRIVGTLVQVGEGKMTAEQVQETLQSSAPQTGGYVAPAHGLILRRVLYASKKTSITSAPNQESEKV
jgi:tRNA pseudouridine38-40 synthase